MKLSIAIAALASVVLSTVEAQVPSFTNFTKCVGNSVDLVTVTSAKITPYPICIKQKYCISVTGNSQVPITQVMIISQNIIIAGRLWPYDPETDLCKYLAESGNSYPIPAVQPNPERVPKTPENPQGLLGVYARNCSQRF
ncbi:hypothetical protein BGX24_008425 [Mortierella sp. AD032]|nr:hypothetical protein BGX24_008425 [Mortierella sp. AD032]